METPLSREIALYLKGKAIDEIVEQSKLYVKGITGNVWFPCPNPPLEILNQAIAKVEEAIEKAKTKSMGAIVHRNKEMVNLSCLLKVLKLYVEKVAFENPDHAQAIVRSANMQEKKLAALKPERSFSARQTNYPGEVKLDNKAVERGSHHYQMSTDPELAPENWMDIYKGTRASFVIAGLDSGVRHFFRARKVDKDGESEWGEVVSLVVL